ncbi:inorganic triphosphatase [Siccibacter turicensis]|uniref:CYTH domain-containing protein n=1 Tax=Siccibacter turicensis TaxID=357233 RepID=UPI003F55EA29
MAQEIELKFIVQQDAVPALRALLDTLGGDHQPPRQLHNTYYETADTQLRRHDMGLRVRGDNGRCEMTIKTAGRVVGGLHQRPEYNVPLESEALDLARFPAEIWPEGMDVVALQQAVQPLFSTDFLREKWVVTHGESQIEIGLDQGEVKSGDLSEPLCEMELELLSGTTADLLKLARQLVAQPGIRQGSLSKAARGYHLAQGNAPRQRKPLGILKLRPKATVEQALEASLEMALAHWQYHEELWVRGMDEAKADVVNAIGLVRHALMLFGGIVPRKASTHLRDLLTHFDVSLTQGLPAENLAYSAESGITKLALTDWLISRRWQPYLDEKAQAKIADSFKRFADTHLSRHAAELRNAFERPLGDKYRDQLPRLARETDALRLLAGVYDDAVSAPWLENWEGLRHAIETRQRIEIEHYRNEAISQAPFWRHSGKR